MVLALFDGRKLHVVAKHLPEHRVDLPWEVQLHILEVEIEKGLDVIPCICLGEAVRVAQVSDAARRLVSVAPARLALLAIGELRRYA